MHKYIAITIGPISRITGAAVRTGALWASSYFFSYLAKRIIEKFKDREFLIPIVGDKRLWSTSNGIGRFPDRYIFKSHPGDFVELKKQVTLVFDDIAEQIEAFIEPNIATKEKISEYLHHAIKVYFFEKEFSNGNVIQECNSILDLMEMQDTYNLIEPCNYLNAVFESVKLYDSFLAKDAFGNDQHENKPLFEPLEEISRKEYKELINKKMLRHNYIAIISADVDNMGVFNSTASLEEIIAMNSKMLEFGEAIINPDNEQTLDKEYGARIVFIGGDDLLIFSPVTYNRKTVFDLVDKISDLFDRVMSSPKASNNPTLSFGISITYYKFPMGEALSMSEKELKKSKSFSGKNMVSFSLQKHSGQTFCANLKKGNPIFKQFITLVNGYKEDENKLLSSTIYWLENNRQVLSIILDGDRNRERLENYFENSFDEPIHDSVQPFFNDLKDFLIKTHKTENDAIGMLVSALRFTHFIKTDSHEI